MMKFLRRRVPRVDPKELDRQTQEVNDMLEQEGPKMKAIAAYLEKRRLQNGFGTDFELTLQPRSTS